MRADCGDWVEKAEGDWRTADRELHATAGPTYDAVVFHAQQCVEKYLKARLIEAGQAFPKTRDLGALLDLVLPLEPGWLTFREHIDWLTSIGVEVRYPGANADRDDAARAHTVAARFRQTARQALGAGT